MATYPHSTLRDEVQRYLQVCEELLAATRPFTIEEMALIQYYQAEVAQIRSVSTEA